MNKKDRREHTIKTIENSVKTGFSLSEVVRMLLGRSLAEFGKEHGFKPEEVSMCLNGYSGRRLPEIRKATARALGINPSDMDKIIENLAERNLRP